MSIISPCHQVLDDFFNATLTFRSDSDIPVPYGRVVARRGSVSPGQDDWLEKKPVDVSLFDRDILAVVKNKTRSPPR